MAALNNDRLNTQSWGGDTPPINVYIENIHDQQTGGFAIPLPATSDDIKPFFERTGINSWQDVKIAEVTSEIEGLGEILSGIIKSAMSENMLDEVNYLAYKITNLLPGDPEIFKAIINSGRHFNSIADLIDLTFTGNLYTLGPDFDGSQHKGIINYHDQRYIPEICRLSAAFNKPGMMINNVDIAVLLTEIYALSGDYNRDAGFFIKRIAEGGDTFFIKMRPDVMIITSADSVYRRNLLFHGLFLTRRSNIYEHPEIRSFFLSVTERGSGKLIGSLYEIANEAINNNIIENSILFTHVDAEMTDGTKRRFTFEEWENKDGLVREQLKSWEIFYAPTDETRLAAHLPSIGLACENICRPVSAEAFLTKINAFYMERAQHPVPGMLRITPDMAREILAKDAAHIFRLASNGPEKLSPIDAVKKEIWNSVNSEFAVRKQDLPKIEKWARRAAGEILRQIERKEDTKIRSNER